MESRARVIDCHRDWITKKYQLVLEVDYISKEECLKGEKRLILKQWRNTRSLDANRYMWALLDQIAMMLDSSRDEIYEQMLQDYGILDTNVVITASSTTDPGAFEGHWKFYRTDGAWTAYIKIRGTSTYDTKEMSYFLDRVIEEAKNLGIETATPEELERIKGYERQRAG